ncbi:MAG TPA: ABC transporter substrate-binding protein, partial [Spirochaetia bacterium]|nr:ABC transporter substrate-binding protein [Spirochaetia bacterium]
MNRIPRILIAMAASAALGLQAAAQAQPDPAEAPPPQEFVIGLGDYRLELNPYKSIYAHEMQMFTAIYEGLFTYDPQSLDPVRAQAESYAKSADGRTWTFTIREDARWWDGSPVTAGDF